MMDAPLIEARAVDKTFDSTPVLRGVNLKIGPGACAIIAGRNGAGKSTLIRILAGLSMATGGEALLFGREARGLPAEFRKRVGLVIHQSLLYPNLTGIENLEFYADLYGLDRRLADPYAWIEKVGLAKAGRERVRTYSRGMEQRLSLARALMVNPEVLLADEPVAALDPDGVLMVRGLLQEASARGCAIVITAHDTSNVIGISADVYELVRGRLVGFRASVGSARAAG